MMNFYTFHQGIRRYHTKSSGVETKGLIDTTHLVCVCINTRDSWPASNNIHDVLAIKPGRLPTLNIPRTVLILLRGHTE